MSDHSLALKEDDFDLSELPSLPLPIQNKFENMKIDYKTPPVSITSGISFVRHFNFTEVEE